MCVFFFSVLADWRYICKRRENIFSSYNYLSLYLNVNLLRIYSAVGFFLLPFPHCCAVHFIIAVTICSLSNMIAIPKGLFYIANIL